MRAIVLGSLQRKKVARLLLLAWQSRHDEISSHERRLMWDRCEGERLRMLRWGQAGSVQEIVES